MQAVKQLVLSSIDAATLFAYEGQHTCCQWLRFPQPMKVAFAAGHSLLLNTEPSHTTSKWKGEVSQKDHWVGVKSCGVVFYWHLRQLYEQLIFFWMLFAMENKISWETVSVLNFSREVMSLHKCMKMWFSAMKKMSRCQMIIHCWGEITFLVFEADECVPILDAHARNLFKLTKKIMSTLNRWLLPEIVLWLLKIAWR